MKTVTFLYKCRRCGQISEYGRTSDNNISQFLTEALTYGVSQCNNTAPLTRLSYHMCDENNWGVQDLIGCKTIDE